MKIFDSPASIILTTNSDGARYDICGFSQLKESVSQDDHVCAVERCAVDRHTHRGVLEAAPAHEAEVLLVDRRGDDQLAVEIADDAAREHVRARERIAVADGEDAVVVEAEYGDLLALHQGAHAAVRHDVFETADSLHAHASQIACHAISPGNARLSTVARTALGHLHRPMHQRALNGLR